MAPEKPHGESVAVQDEQECEQLLEEVTEHQQEVAE
jgi:hypothetical protein